MPETTQSDIAVVIAARNAGSFIGEALASLAVQKEPASQVIVYDDGSRDRTFEIAREFEGRLAGLEVIRGESGQGISRARNLANQRVTASHIAVLDADDLFLPDSIAHYRSFLSENPEIDLVYGDTLIVNRELTHGFRQRYPRFQNNRQAIRRILGSPLIPFKHSSMLIRRQSLEELGGYDESLPKLIDVDLFLRFLAKGKKVGKLNATTSIHRKHDRQVSTRRLAGLQIYRRLLRTYERDPLMRALLYLFRFPSEILKLIVGG